MEISVDGMKRVGDVETEIGILNERTETMKECMEKIERKVEKVTTKVAWINGVIGMVIVLVIKYWT